MLARFAGEARHAVEAAMEEAAALDAPAVEPEHLLLGVLRAPGAARVRLEAAGADADAVREALDDLLAEDLAGAGISLREVRDSLGRPGVTPVATRLPFSPLAKASLQGALRATARRRARRIGTEHLLCGVLRAGGARPRRALVALGVDPDALEPGG